MATALVDCAWVAEHHSDPDVRLIHIDRDGLDSYEAGHIPGAIGWNWKTALWDPAERQFPSQSVFARRLGDAGISADTIVVLYGVPVQYGPYAWWVFRYLGHRDVRLLDGGLTRWTQEGRPLEHTTPATHPVTYHPGAKYEQIRAGRDDVMRALEGAQTTLLDHRSIEEYSGDRVSPPGMADHGAERRGRLPGARHLPYDAFLNRDDTFKSPSELRALVSPVLGGEDSPAVSYCRLAHRASLACFVLTEILGYRNIRVYDGSWTEWGSMVGVPIER